MLTAPDLAQNFALRPITEKNRVSPHSNPLKNNVKIKGHFCVRGILR
jgi:hypothetical protein